MRDVVKDVWFAFPFHMDEYGIRNIEDLYAICTQTEHTVSLMLLGAGKGGYKQFLSTTTSRNESVSLGDGGGFSQGQRIPDYEFNNKSSSNKGMLGSIKNFVMGRR